MKINKLVFFLIVLVLVLGYFNSKYPFFTNSSKGWVVGYNSTEKHPFKQFDLSYNFVKYSELNKLLKHEKSLFLADPFFQVKNDSVFLFVENQIQNDNARIDVYASSKENIDFKYLGIALDEPFHLSYPQVFKEEGVYYMLPETKKSNNVLLYTTDNYPFDWKVCDTLIKNVLYKDPTYFKHQNKSYLFVCDDELNMYVYYSDNLRGIWKEHSNYTKLRGNEARCAGRVFNYNGKHYLPMQNLRDGYGTGVSLYSILVEKESIKLVKEKHLFLKPQDSIPEFSKGMHHIDIQKFGDAYFSVYDGNEKTVKKNFNWKRTLKYNLIDLNLY